MKTKLTIILALTFLLTACGEQPSVPTETSTLPPTETITQIPTGTATQVPPTDTPTEPAATGTPTISVIPYATNEGLLFHVPDFTPVWETTTPIPQPAAERRDFDLKALTIGDYIDLIHQMDTYASENDRFGLSESRPYFEYNQVQIRYVLLETLRAFPDTEYTEQLQWKLALTNAVLANYESDEWIIQQIEDGLNQALFSPGNMDDYLNQYGFEVQENFTIVNLFGELEDGQVFIINTTHQHNIGGTEDGLVAALRGNQPGEYELYLAASRWSFSHGWWNSWTYYPDICGNHSDDLNNNGQPEICLFYELGYSGSFPQELILLEWQGDHFTDLAENLRGWTMDDTITFNPSDLPGIDITISKDIGWVHGLYQYAWDGESLELVSIDYYYLISGIYDRFNRNELTDVIELLSQLIADGPPYDAFYWGQDSVDAEGTDTLRFLLGLAYAYNSDVAHAREIFKSLAQAPTLEEFPFISEIGSIFVDRYIDEADLADACDAATSEEISALNSGQSEQDLFGYYVHIIDPVIRFCTSDMLTLYGFGLNDQNPGLIASLEQSSGYYEFFHQNDLIVYSIDQYYDWDDVLQNDLVYETYRWDEDVQNYTETDLVEYFLFTQNDPTATIQLVTQILNVDIEYDQMWDRPRLLYLLGVAYELNGNLNEARQTYFDLWYYYPESPYAIMARAKLEPVSP